MDIFYTSSHEGEDEQEILRYLQRPSRIHKYLVIFGIGLERTYQCQMILFNDCRLCKECSKVRNGAMRSDVQTKVSEDVILGALQI